MENEYITCLYDYYGKLLTDNQKRLFEDYYFDNLTLIEIAENNNITKNAVSKQLIVIKDKLINYEKVLKLNKNNIEINNIIKDLDKKMIEKINKYI